MFSHCRIYERDVESRSNTRLWLFRAVHHILIAIASVSIIAGMPSGVRAMQDDTGIEGTSAAKSKPHFSPPSEHEWLRSEGTKNYFRYCVQVLMPNGQVARNALVKARWGEEIPVTRKENGLHEFEIPFQQGFNAPVQIQARSEDGLLLGMSSIGQHASRSLAKNGIQISLGDARLVTVSVSHNGSMVPDAEVALEGSFGQISGRSGSDGRLDLRIPASAKINGIRALNEIEGKSRMVGGFSFNRKPVRDPNAREILVDVYDSISKTIRIIDIENQPVANFSFELNVATKENYNFIPLGDRANLTTDENGEVVFDWLPDWGESHFYVSPDDESWSRVGDIELVDDAVVAKVDQPDALKRKTITGQVQLPENVPGGLMISLGTFQHPQEGRYDPLFARCDAQGRFTANVIPDATYSVCINDVDWVSDYWTGILFETELSQSASPELVARKGETVEVLVTFGPEKKPLPNTNVSLNQKNDFSWIENGKTRNGSLGRQWWVTTDAHGKAVANAVVGELNAYIYTPEWKPDRKIEIESEKRHSIHFHRKSLGKRVIHGFVRLPESMSGQETDLFGAQVHLVPLDNESVEEATAQADSDGNFQFEMAASRIGAFVRTADGKAAATYITDNPDSDLEFELKPTVDYHGVMLFPNNDPVKDKWVRAIVKLQNPGRSWQNAPQFVKSVFDVATIEARTNQDGEFTLEGIPVETIFDLRYETSDNDRGGRAGQRFVRVGENRPLETIRIGGELAVETPPVPMSTLVDEKVADCRGANINLLIAFTADGVNVGEFVRSHFYDDDENRDLYSFLPFWIDGAAGRDKPDRMEYYKQRDWKIPEEDHVLALVLNGQGDEVSRLLLTVTDENAVDSLKQFVKENVPAKTDARKKYAAALAEAKESDRKVWVRISQTRCAPCYSFTRWLDKHDELLKRDYVMLKIDNVSDKNGIEIAKKIWGDQSTGVPYHQIVDADGQVLIDSVGPLGNIGFPGSEFESREHLKEMITQTAKRLTDKEIDEVIEDIIND